MVLNIQLYGTTTEKITCLLPPPLIMSTVFILCNRLNSCHLLFIKIEYTKLYLTCIHSGVSSMSHFVLKLHLIYPQRRAVIESFRSKLNSDMSLKCLSYKTEPPLRRQSTEHASEMLFTISRLMLYRTFGTIAFNAVQDIWDRRVYSMSNNCGFFRTYTSLYSLDLQWCEWHCQKHVSQFALNRLWLLWG